MDHDDVLERLELAAVEPGGLDRLVAGDTPAAAVIGHLAGCEPCAEELRRLSRATPLLRDVVRTTPSADLRDRTLAFVREHGRQRGSGIGAAPVATMGAAAGSATAASAGRAGEDRTAVSPRSRRILPWVATIAATIALVVSGLSYVTNRDLADRVATQTASISALETVQRETLSLTGDPASRRVELASTTGGTEMAGTLLFSPVTQRLVVVAYDLDQPPAGQEYRCWVEIDGQRHNVGKMFFADELAFWVGQTPEVANLPSGARFGVSPTAIGSPSLEADPIISGQL